MTMHLYQQFFEIEAIGEKIVDLKFIEVTASCLLEISIVTSLIDTLCLTP